MKSVLVVLLGILVCVSTVIANSGSDWGAGADPYQNYYQGNEDNSQRPKQGSRMPARPSPGRPSSRPPRGSSSSSGG
eukprot:CAMPEP_0113935352 /NCGR_PEP_ID=MMETSP1339-20121228/2506_1 /TAXON_ID=94617 /ORGANISM="Fibrocapsa japonica" /LENGTH=76 /DNA_ID=CAMNT_0000937459 /DNA_START=161 /DNA_END=388 /DNA_ORIENTATION=+ /assembly_acc=CAM_ASM_000762